MVLFETNFIVGIAATIATFFTLLGNFWCKYTSLLFKVTSNLTDASGEYRLYYGIWNFRDTAITYTSIDGGWYVTQNFFCRAYDTTSIVPDSTWKAAQAFTILAVIIGGVGSCVSCCGNYEVDSWTQRYSIALPLLIAFFVATLCQGLSFLFFSSNACNTIPPLTYNTTLYTVDFTNDCSLESASIMGIMGCIFWFLATVASGFAVMEERKQQQQQQGLASGDGNGHVIKENDTVDDAQQQSPPVVENIKASETANPGEDTPVVVEETTP